VAKLSYPYGIVYDEFSSLLYDCDSVYNTVRSISVTTGVVGTLAGSGTPLSLDGVGTAAAFNFPCHVVSDGLGSLFVADNPAGYSAVIRRVSITTALVTTLAGTAACMPGYGDGLGAAVRFSAIIGGLAVDAGGNVLVGDTTSKAIRRVNAASGLVTTVVGLPGSLYVPAALAYDAASATLLVADGQYIKRARADASGNLAPVLGSVATGFANGAAQGFSGFAGIAGIALAPNGRALLVVDPTLALVRVIAPLGAGVANVSTLAGAAAVYANGEGVGTAAQFWSPQGACYDNFGNVFIADGNNHRLRKILSNGTSVPVAGSLTRSYGSGDGVGTAARFNYLSDVKVDPFDGTSLFIADQKSMAIRYVLANQSVSTYAGGQFLSLAGFADGVGPNARFNWPFAIATDPLGPLYVADTKNHAIRVVNRDRSVWTLAGAGQAGWLDGIGTGAFFNSPQGIAYDAARLLLYVADTVRPLAPPCRVRGT